MPDDTPGTSRRGLDDDLRRAARTRRTLVAAVAVAGVIAVGLVAAVVAMATSGGGASEPADVVGLPADDVTSTTTATTTTTTTAVEAPATTAAPTPTTTAAPTPSGSTTYMYPLVPASAGKYGHSHHDYPANDMFAPCGTQVVSPVAGVVQDVSRTDEWSSKSDDASLRGGISVSVVGNDGVRYYGSHLSSVDPGVSPGDKVQPGTPLGKVGDTGNAKGTGCHLHFGISPPTRAGDWEVRRGAIYPWPYLDSWRDGGQKSPVAEVKAYAAKHGLG